MVKPDMLRGEIPGSREAYSNLTRIALPAVAEMVFAALIGMADTIMVGQLGPQAVAAVGLTNQPRFLFLCLFFAFNTGVTAIISRRKGEGERGEARQCLRMAILLALALSAVMTALALAFNEPVMLLAGAKADTIDMSKDYFFILCTGLVLSTMSMLICAAQRGIGNTRVTMAVGITANVFNVLFNFLLIEGRFGFPRLEVRGAAIAGLIGFFAGFMFALFSVLKKDAYLRISLSDSWRPHIATLKNILRVSWGAVVEQAVLRVGFFSFARVVADLGTLAFAAHQIAMQLMNLSFTFAEGIAAATTSLVGQNLGKKRPDLSIMYVHIGQRIALMVSAVLMILSFAGRNFFPTLFVDDAATIHMAAGVIVILGFIQPVQTSSVIMSGSLRGAGDTRFVAFTMLLTVAIMRPCISLFFVYGLGLGLPGAWYAIIIDMSVRLVILIARFLRGKWIGIRV